MNSYLKVLLLLLLLSPGACALLPDTPMPADSLVLRIRADQQINHYQGRAHALVMHIYQLESPDGFRRALALGNGPGDLLNGSAAPFPSLSREALVIQPGQHSEVRIARAEKSRYLAVVVGYYRPSVVSDYARLYALDVEQDGLAWWRRVLSARVRVDLVLGAGKIGGRG